MAITREEHLAELQKQLDEGTYTIDLDLLAELIIDEEDDLTIERQGHRQRSSEDTDKH